MRSDTEYKLIDAWATVRRWLWTTFAIAIVAYPLGFAALALICNPQ